MPTWSSRATMGSSDQRAWRRSSRPWASAWVLVVLLLALVEGALRVPAVRRALPPRTHFYHQSIAQRIDEIERILQVHGGMDVLFVGSSIVYTDVNPLVFDGLARQRLGDIVSMNVGLAGVWPLGVQLYLEHVWLPLTQPRLVVQGVRYSELLATTEAKHETQIWTGRVEAGWRDAGWLTRLDAAAVSRVHLLQYRGSLVSLLGRYMTGLPASQSRFWLTRGHIPRPSSGTGPLIDIEDDPSNAGVCERGCAVGLSALRDAIAASRDAGAAYVLANVPEHAQRWRFPRAPERYAHYLDMLRALAASEDVPFVDVTRGDPFAYSQTRWFGDTSHMTAAGARVFTGQLAHELQPALAAALGRSDGDRAGSSGVVARPAAHRRVLP